MNYRDKLQEIYDINIASAVGCGLDRLKRDVTDFEISIAVQFYNDNRELFHLNSTPIGEQRELIRNYIESSDITRHSSQ